MANHHYAGIESKSNQKTLGGYIIGFVLCIILTCASFGLMETRVLDGADLYCALAALAVIQLIVQSVFFLRLNSSSEGKWNLLPFLFTLLVIAILVSGSLWIMYNLNYNMMN